MANSADDAQRIIDRLNKGENFVALAVAESVDPSAAAGGGRAGCIIGPKQVKTPGFRQHVEEYQGSDEPGENASEILNQLGGEPDQICFHGDGQSMAKD